jgi:hypothetical protein
VEPAGLEPATKRLWTVDDSLRGTRRVSARTPASIADATMRPVLEQAGDTDSARQATIDSGLDEAWRQESQRYRPADVALAAGLPCGDAVDRCGTGFDFGQPLPSPCDRSDELDPGIGTDREDCGW